VILGILSQNGAFGEPCDWTKNRQEETSIVFWKCETLKIDPVFLGSESQEFPHLKNLEIQFTSLAVVEDKSFIRATNLQTLNLSNNKIERVDKNAFSGLKKLRKLYLEKNKIPNLPMGVFDELQELVELFLENNSLTSFDFSIVKQNHQLNTLWIFANAITNVMTSQKYSSNLTYISMSRNSLTSLPMKNLPDLPNLKLLTIHSNKLTEFDFESVKDKFPKLETFFFFKNQFDCCFMVNMVRKMLLHMPKLWIGSAIIKHLNDTEELQRQNLCVKCVQKRLDELEVIIGNLTDANRNMTMTIEKIEAENRNMTVNIGNLTEANRNLTITIEKIGAENRNMTVNIGNLTMTIEKIGAENRNMAVNIGNLTEANRNLTITIEKIGAENRNMTVNIGNLTMTIEKIGAENRNMAVNIGNLTDANRNLTMSIEKIEAEIRNMKVIIGNLTEAKRNTTVIVGTTKDDNQHLYIMGSAFAIGVAIIDIVLVAIGSIVSRHSRKPEKPKSNNIELQEDGDFMEIE
jgi:Leucine rich repeat